MRCEMTSPGVEECALRARSTHGVHHAIVEVNIVIGVVLGELHVVVRVDPVDVCDDAVVRRTLGLIALVVIVVFVVAIFHRILLYGRYTLYSEGVRRLRAEAARWAQGLESQVTNRCDGLCPLSVFARIDWDSTVT